MVDELGFGLLRVGWSVGVDGEIVGANENGEISTMSNASDVGLF